MDGTINFLEEMGFESCEEFNRLVADADLSSPEKIAAFKKWQHEDGSKAGLLKLDSPNPANIRADGNHPSLRASIANHAWRRVEEREGKKP